MFKLEWFPRKWPCFAIGLNARGDEFTLHMWLVCLRVYWGPK